MSGAPTVMQDVSLAGRRMLRRLIDITLLFSALYLAYLLRFDWDIPAEFVTQFAQVCGFVVAVEYMMMVAFRVVDGSWRYVSITDLGLLIRALYIGSTFFAILRLLGPGVMTTGLIDQLTSIPLSVTVGNFLTTVVMLGGVRAVRRSLSEQSQIRKVDAPELKRTLLIGAGDAGVVVARQIRMRPDLGLDPVGFIDNDPNKRGQRIHGLDVLGDVDHLPQLLQRLDVDELLIAINQPPGDMVRRLGEIAAQAGIEVRKVAGLVDVVAGRVDLRPRSIQLSDLLRRDPVDIDLAGVANLVHGRAVLVTGAGGSIGSELCRQLLPLGPTALVMVERNENALYQIDYELQPGRGSTASGTQLISAIADITDAQRMRDVLQHYRPALVFHAAAHKHVPMMEANPAEAVKNNVWGTRTLVDECVQAGVERFVLISTDKAVNPTSVMGATKRVAERYVIATAKSAGVAYSAVRFGNVLGSNGSVVPLFKRQIERGGPITVTHPDVKRYFMTIPEAVQLVLQTSVLGEGGDIFVLDMGEQIKITDLARDLIRLSGLVEGSDIDIEYVGLRPGEKLYEELGLGSEQMDQTAHSKIFRWTAQQEGTTQAELAYRLAGIDLGAAPQELRDLVPEFTGVTQVDEPSPV